MGSRSIAAEDVPEDYLPACHVRTMLTALPLRLCRWPTGLFERVNQRIARQIEKVEDMTGDMDHKTNFALIVIQTELERYKFIVRSYLRSRIAKVSLGRGKVLGDKTSSC